MLRSKHRLHALSLLAVLVAIASAVGCVIATQEPDQAKGTVTQAVAGGSDSGSDGGTGSGSDDCDGDGDDPTPTCIPAVPPPDPPCGMHGDVCGGTCPTYDTLGPGRCTLSAANVCSCWYQTGSD